MTCVVGSLFNSACRTRSEILNDYGMDRVTRLLFFSLSERYGSLGRCRQIRLLRLGLNMMNESVGQLLVHFMIHEMKRRKDIKLNE